MGRAEQLRTVEVDTVGFVRLPLGIDHDAADESRVGADGLVDHVVQRGGGVGVGVLAVLAELGVVVAVGLAAVDDGAALVDVILQRLQLALGEDRRLDGFGDSGRGDDDHLVLRQVLLGHLAFLDVFADNAVVGADLDEGGFAVGVVAGDVEVLMAVVQADVGHLAGRIGGLVDLLGVGVVLSLELKGKAGLDLIGVLGLGIGGRRREGHGELLGAAGCHGLLLGLLGNDLALGLDLVALEGHGLGLGAVGEGGEDVLLDALGGHGGVGLDVDVRGYGFLGPDRGGHGDVAVTLDDLDVVVGVGVLQLELELRRAAADSLAVQGLASLADHIEIAELVAGIRIVQGDLNRDLLGLVILVHRGDIAELVPGVADLELVVDLQVLVLGGVDASGIQCAVDADLGEVVGQNDVTAGVGVAEVALVVVLVVGGGQVPAHTQGLVVLGIGGEVAGAADLAFAVADLHEVQLVVTLGSVAHEVAEGAEGGAGVVELGDHGHRVAVLVERDVLGGVDAGDLGGFAHALDLEAARLHLGGVLGIAVGLGLGLAGLIQALVGKADLLVVGEHAGVVGLVVEHRVVSRQGAVGVEGVGVAGAAGPGHLIAVHAQEVLVQLVVVVGGDSGLLPLGHGAGRVHGQRIEIVVGGVGGGLRGVEVVGVVGDEDVVQIRDLVGMLIGLLQGAGAVGILRGVGVDLAVVQGLAALADEEAPALAHALAVGSGDREIHAVLAVGERRSGLVADLVRSDLRGDLGAVELQIDGGILSDVGDLRADLGCGLIAGGGVGRREELEDQRLVLDVHGLLILNLQIHRVLGVDLDRQLRSALERLSRDHEGADLAVHLGYSLLVAGPVDAVAAEQLLELVEVVDGEAHLAVAADGGCGLIERDRRIDHVAGAVLVVDLVEVHRVLAVVAGIVGVAAEQIAEVLDHDAVGAPERGLVLHEPAAVDLGQGPLGVVALGVNQDQALVVGGLALVVGVVLGHGEIFLAGLEGVIISVDDDVEDEAAVGNVVIAERVVLQLGRRHQQVLLGGLGSGLLTENASGRLVVDDDLIAVHRQGRSLCTLTDASVGIGGGFEELELIVLDVVCGGVSPLGIAAELLSVVLFQIDIGLAVPLVLGVHDVENAFRTRGVGQDAPLGAGLGTVGEHQLFLVAGVDVLQHEVLVADLEVVVLSGLDELDDHGTVRQIVDGVALVHLRHGQGRGVAFTDIITDDIAVALAAGVDRTVGTVRRQAIDDGRTLADLRGQGHGGQHGENHNQRQKDGYGSLEMLLHRLSSFNFSLQALRPSEHRDTYRVSCILPQSQADFQPFPRQSSPLRTFSALC